MTHRKLLLGTVAALVCLAAASQGAEAAWKGVSQFTATTKGSWALDGLYGPRTIAAVSAFQQAHGLRVDGVAGPATMKALGLTYKRSLKLGMGGDDVYALQQALAKQGFWYGQHGKATPMPKPKASAKPVVKPKPKPTATGRKATGPGGAPKPRPTAKPLPHATPTPSWIEPPVMNTPSPEQTMTPGPEATPAPEMTPQPMESGMPESIGPANTPTLELGAGTWFLPGPAGGTSYDFSFSRPTWTGDATLWLGNFGIGGDLTVFNTTYATFRTAPYFQANTYMYDGLLKYRFDHGFYNVFAGYRGLGMGDLNFGTLGLGLDRPLLGDWLWLDAKAQGGHNFSTSYFLDGQAALELRFNPVSLNLGFRHLLLQAGTDPQFNTNGPTAAIKLRF